MMPVHTVRTNVLGRNLLRCSRGVVRGAVGARLVWSGELEVASKRVSYCVRCEVRHGTRESPAAHVDYDKVLGPTRGDVQPVGVVPEQKDWRTVRDRAEAALRFDP